MSKKVDEKSVLRYLADSMDTGKTLEKFPGLTPRHLSDIITRASGRMDKTVTAVTKIWVDGAARGNPGDAGAGAYMEIPGREPSGRGEFLGRTTNNVAEYKALLLGLEMAKDLDLEKVEIYSDSQLMIKQMTGEYRVKNEDLRMLFNAAKEAENLLKSVSYRHVPREDNLKADRLANMAIDARGGVNL